MSSFKLTLQIGGFQLYGSPCHNPVEANPIPLKEKAEC